MVRDYNRLIEQPWNIVCKNYFSEYKRPLHASELPNPSKEQMNILNYFSA